VRHRKQQHHGRSNLKLLALPRRCCHLLPQLHGAVIAGARTRLPRRRLLHGCSGRCLHALHLKLQALAGQACSARAALGRTAAITRCSQLSGHGVQLLLQRADGSTVAVAQRLRRGGRVVLRARHKLLPRAGVGLHRRKGRGALPLSTLQFS
jgi:hypothetical protein